MDRTRGAIAGVCVVVMLTAVAFGPLVAGISLSKDTESQVGEEQGSIAVNSIAFPATATIEPAAYGAANHQVTMPPATVRIQTLSGTPILVYKISIAPLGVQFSTAHFLDEQTPLPYELTLEPATLTGGSVGEEYTGEAAVVAIDSSGRQTVANQTVTVRWAQ